MCDFSRVSAWFCDEKISLKKSCFYLYIRRYYVYYWSASSTCKGYGFYGQRTKKKTFCKYVDMVVNVIKENGYVAG